PALTLLSFSTHAHPPDLHPFPTRRSSDLLPRHRLDDVLVQRDLVRHPEQRVVADVDLRLTRGADLVVLDLDVDARFDETPGHLRTQVLIVVRGRNGEVALLVARLVGQVAAVLFGAGVPCPFHRIDEVEG